MVEEHADVGLAGEDLGGRSAVDGLGECPGHVVYLVGHAVADHDPLEGDEAVVGGLTGPELVGVEPAHLGLEAQFTARTGAARAGLGLFDRFGLVHGLGLVGHRNSPAGESTRRAGLGIGLRCGFALAPVVNRKFGSIASAVGAVRFGLFAHGTGVVAVEFDVPRLHPARLVGRLGALFGDPVGGGADGDRCLVGDSVRILGVHVGVDEVLGVLAQIGQAHCQDGRECVAWDVGGHRPLG